MVRPAILIAALAQTALAFSGTHPIVVWSSHRCHIAQLVCCASAHNPNSSDALASASKSTNARIFLERLLSDDSICDHDAVVLVDHMGVRILLRIAFATS